MNIKLTIEIDENAVRTLEKRASERGVSIGELVAELAGDARVADPNEIAELNRRWATVEAGAPVVAHEKVVRWLADWGSDFRPWPGQ